jgi:hypothetical protein
VGLSPSGAPFFAFCLLQVQDLLQRFGLRQASTIGFMLSQLADQCYADQRAALQHTTFSRLVVPKGVPCASATASTDVEILLEVGLWAGERVLSQLGRFGLGRVPNTCNPLKKKNKLSMQYS